MDILKAWQSAVSITRALSRRQASANGGSAARGRAAAGLVIAAWIWGAGLVSGAVNLPFPQSANYLGYGLRPTNMTQIQLNAAVSNYYGYWKTNYLTPSTKVAGDYKINYDGTGTTVSEAMGYGMLIAAYMAGADANARNYFDGLNRFRKRYPSNINAGLMCWRIPADESAVSDDCATDGDLDMAMALLLAHRQWGDGTYLTEATNYLNSIAAGLVRGDYSLRLGDWNSAGGQTRPSDFMPAHFRSFFIATGNGLWTNVENKCYAILEQLQTNAAPATGLVPDFSVTSSGNWTSAPPNFLESANDGFYYYNSCRVPWRIGWAAWFYNDARARRVLSRFMNWTISHHTAPINFKAGYKLDGSNISGNGYDTACFISPTGVAAMTTTNQSWLNSTFSYATARREGYYEDSVSLLSLLVMSGNAWLVTSNPAPKFTAAARAAGGNFVLGGTGPTNESFRLLATTNLTLPAASWSDIGGGLATGGVFNITDTQAASYPARYYRIKTP